MKIENIDIWGDVLEGTSKPSMTSYILDTNRNRGAILILPGGGYEYVSDREAEPIAIKFSSAGYQAFVLNYSVAPSKHPQPLLDVSRAMCLIRENAIKWRIDPEKIAVIGFSAGGHLAGSLGVHWNKEYLHSYKGLIKGWNKPNALILSYPVLTSGEFAHRGSFENLLGENPLNEILEEMSLENQVSKDTPPTFIWHTLADTVVPVENTLLFANALRKQNIPFELHIYPHGPHGLSLGTKQTEYENMGCYPLAATWLELCLGWIGDVFDIEKNIKQF